jgi:hypothetical protein
VYYDKEGGGSSLHMALGIGNCAYGDGSTTIWMTK